MVNFELALGALLLTITHVGFIFIGASFVVVSRRKYMHIIGWLLTAFGFLGIFASIYMGLYYQTGLDH